MHVLFLTADTEFLKTDGGTRRLFLQGIVESTEVLHIIVLTPHNSTYTKHKLIENVWIYPTNTFSLFQFFKILSIAQFELLWKQEFRAHIVYSDDTNITAWAGWLLAYVYRRVWIANIQTHAWGFDAHPRRLFSRITAMPLWFMFSQAFRVCIFSDTTRLYLLSHLTPGREKKLVIFPRLYDITAVEEVSETDVKTEYPELNFIIVTVATLSRWRDLRVALMTLKLLRARIYYPKAGMVIIASGFAAFLARVRARSAGISEWVHVQKASPTLGAYIKTANIFLYLSKGKENEDLLIRAAAVHCPIIAVDDVLAREVIQDGVNGSIVHNPTPGGLANLISSINQGAAREIFKVNSSMNLKQIVVASREEVVQAFTALWNYQVAPEPLPQMPEINLHSIEPPEPTKLQKRWAEFKKVWAEMFPSQK